LKSRDADSDDSDRKNKNKLGVDLKGGVKKSSRGRKSSRKPKLSNRL